MAVTNDLMNEAEEEVDRAEMFDAIGVDAPATAQPATDKATARSEGFLCDRCGDPVDRARRTEVDVCATCRKEIDNGMAARGIKPATDTQDVPPERITLFYQNGRWLKKWYVPTVAPTLEGYFAEYVLASTAEGLAEALREMYETRFDVAGTPRQEIAFKSAAATLAKYEGKGKS